MPFTPGCAASRCARRARRCRPCCGSPCDRRGRRGPAGGEFGIAPASGKRWSSGGVIGRPVAGPRRPAERHSARRERHLAPAAPIGVSGASLGAGGANWRVGSVTWRRRRQLARRCRPSSGPGAAGRASCRFRHRSVPMLVRPCGGRIEGSRPAGAPSKRGTAGLDGAAGPVPKRPKRPVRQLAPAPPSGVTAISRSGRRYRLRGMPSHETCHTVAVTSLGDLTVARAGDAITGLYFTARWRPAGRRRTGPWVDAGSSGCSASSRIYLAGERARRSTVPVAPHGGDALQRRVWDLLTEIPYGRTTTYGATRGEGRGRRDGPRGRRGGGPQPGLDPHPLPPRDRRRRQPHRVRRRARHQAPTARDRARRGRRRPADADAGRLSRRGEATDRVAYARDPDARSPVRRTAYACAALAALCAAMPAVPRRARATSTWTPRSSARRRARTWSRCACPPPPTAATSSVTVRAHLGEVPCRRRGPLLLPAKETIDVLFGVRPAAAAALGRRRALRGAAGPAARRSAASS